MHLLNVSTSTTICLQSSYKQRQLTKVREKKKINWATYRRTYRQTDNRITAASVGKTHACNSSQLISIITKNRWQTFSRHGKRDISSYFLFFSLFRLNSLSFSHRLADAAAAVVAEGMYRLLGKIAKFGKLARNSNSFAGCEWVSELVFHPILLGN